FVRVAGAGGHAISHERQRSVADDRRWAGWGGQPSAERGDGAPRSAGDFFCKGPEPGAAAGSGRGPGGGGAFAGEPHADASGAFVLVVAAGKAAAGDR